MNIVDIATTSRELLDWNYYFIVHVDNDVGFIVEIQIMYCGI